MALFIVAMLSTLEVGWYCLCWYDIDICDPKYQQYRYPLP